MIPLVISALAVAAAIHHCQEAIHHYHENYKREWLRKYEENVTRWSEYTTRLKKEVINSTTGTFLYKEKNDYDYRKYKQPTNDEVFQQKTERQSCKKKLEELGFVVEISKIDKKSDYIEQIVRCGGADRDDTVRYHQYTFKYRYHIITHKHDPSFCEKVEEVLYFEMYNMIRENPLGID